MQQNMNMAVLDGIYITVIKWHLCVSVAVIASTMSDLTKLSSLASFSTKQ